jgi:hypothetical protein
MTIVTGQTREALAEEMRGHLAIIMRHTNVSMVYRSAEKCVRLLDAIATAAQAQSEPQAVEPIGWQFRHVFPTHASEWHSVLALPMNEMRGRDGCRYETRLVYAPKDTQ